MLSLIKKDCLTKAWVESKSKEIGGNPVLVEKMVFAFSLLGYLTQVDENFIFKGGTSILLHVPQLRRLSIDIDIVYEGEVELLIDRLAAITQNAPFVRFEENIRGEQGLPKRKHFKFYTKPLKTDTFQGILLYLVRPKKVNGKL